jgi:hypothetical protein
MLGAGASVNIFTRDSCDAVNDCNCSLVATQVVPLLNPQVTVYFHNYDACCVDNRCGLSCDA